MTIDYAGASDALKRAALQYEGFVNAYKALDELGGLDRRMSEVRQALESMDEAKASTSKELEDARAELKQTKTKVVAILKQAEIDAQAKSDEALAESAKQIAKSREVSDRVAADSLAKLISVASDLDAQIAAKSQEVSDLNTEVQRLRAVAEDADKAATAAESKLTKIRAQVQALASA